MVLVVELPPVENTGAFSFPYVKLPPPSGRRQVKYLPPQIAPDSYVVTPRTPHTDAAASEDKQSSEDDRWLDRPYLDCDMRGEESLWAALTVAPYPINLREVVRGIRFPRAVHDSCIQGKVIVRVLVGEDGKYQRHVVLSAAHPFLQEEVERVLPELEFVPGMYRGEPIQGWVTIPFHFRL